MHRSSPGKAVVRVERSAGRDEWADLRPAIHWVQHKRPVLLVAIIMIAAQAAWLVVFLNHMYFFDIDFATLDRAIGSPLSWRYLTYIGLAHLMIGERAIAWALVRTSLYGWGLDGTVLVAFVVASSLAAFRLFRTLFGERPAILIPLVIYLVSPLSVAALGWWSAAMEILPLELATFMALTAHVRYVRTGRRRHLAAAAAWVAIGMLVFEKGLVLPLLLFAVSSAFAAGDGSWLSCVRTVLVRYWRAWVIYTGLLAAYLAVLATSLGSALDRPQVPSSLGALFTFARGLVQNSLLPGAIGGPWRWYPLTDRWFALAAPPQQMQLVALVLAVAVVGTSIVRRPIAWRAWAILAFWLVLADMLPVIISRVNWYPTLRALDTHYLADAVPLLAICVGLAFLPVTDGSVAGAGEPEGRLTYRPAGQPASGQRLRQAATAILAIYIVGSCWSNWAYLRQTTGQSTRGYIATAASAIEAARQGTPVADGIAPGVLGYLASTSSVIGDIERGKLHWIRHPDGTIDGLRIFGADGRLEPAWVYGTSSGPPPRKCWPERHGSILVRFFTSSPYLTTVLRIGYIWKSQTPGVVYVMYDGTVQPLAVKPGLHSAFLSVTGQSNSILVSGLAGRAMCIGDAEAGNLAPVEPGQSGPGAS